MRDYLFGGVTMAFALTSASFAADLPKQKFATVISPPTFTWTGFYAGLNAGAAINHGSMNLTPPDNNFRFFTINNFGNWRKKESETSFVGGAQIGYNYQIGNIVFGAEADFSFSDIRSRTNGFGSMPSGPLLIKEYYRARTQVDWFGTLRARVGVTPLDRLLVYGTGGVAFGQVKTSAWESVFSTIGGFPVEDASWGGSKNNTRLGWALGAGVEYAITNNLSLKTEYLYIDLGKQRVGTIYNNVDPTLIGTTGATIESSTKFSVVRAGLNYRF